MPLSLDKLKFTGVEFFQFCPTEEIQVGFFFADIEK